MKKILILLTMIMGLFVVNKVEAQVALSHTVSNPTGAVTGTGKDTSSIVITQNYPNIGVQVTITKVSGTLSGTATLAGSIDGVGYSTIGSAFTVTDVATQSNIWTTTWPPYKYLRVITVGSGTMSATAQATFLGRK